VGQCCISPRFHYWCTACKSDQWENKFLWSPAFPETLIGQKNRFVGRAEIHFLCEYQLCRKPRSLWEKAYLEGTQFSYCGNAGVSPTENMLQMCFLFNRSLKLRLVFSDLTHVLPQVNFIGRVRVGDNVRTDLNFVLEKLIPRKESSSKRNFISGQFGRKCFYIFFYEFSQNK
jgi:hypothetical protein